jgi:ankyrin repeat protein
MNTTRVHVLGVLQIGGATPLFMASQNGRAEIVRTLLAAGAAVNQTMVSEDGWVRESVESRNVCPPSVAVCVTSFGAP